MVSEREKLTIGTHLDGGRFEIVRWLGEGGFGLTYLAQDHSTGTQVVLKEYFPIEEAVRRDGEVQFEARAPDLATPGALAASEALFSDRVDHPAVAKTFRTFEANGTAYIAMEWVEGETLADVGRAGGITPELLLKAYLTVFDAVLHFGRSGIAHRDLNPRNILIRAADAEPVVIDFGLARAVGPGYTALSRTAAFVQGFEPPEQRDRHGRQGVWTDVYTLSAAVFYVITGHTISSDDTGWPRYERPLRALALQEDASVQRYDRRFLDCIDEGLLGEPTRRLSSAPRLREILRLEREDLQQILAPSVFRQTLLLAETKRLSAPRPVRQEPPKAPKFRYQRCLLQSFDTARFQPNSVQRSDGTLLQTPHAVKIGLARTEAALNLVFGREIVVPAGQIAESPAFMAVFMEMMTAFERHRLRIDAACRDAGLPRFRPMRLALEDAAMYDYVGFVERYEYTGAPLVLLDHARGSRDEQEHQKQRVEGFKSAFLKGEYAALEKGVGQPGYADFARRVREYFSAETTVIADRAVPEVSANDYRGVFLHRLSREALQGTGLDEARAKLPLVDEIKTKLTETKATGFRGNWYLFARDFGEVWPLARAYLDFKLFLTLSRQYRIDHPILVSQEFEYGRFDHSLVFGPQIASELGDATPPAVLDLASSFAAPIDWDEIFEVFVDRDVLGNVRRMNDYYFWPDTSRVRDYVDMVLLHGRLLDTRIGSMRFEVRGDRLCVAPARASEGHSFRYDGFEATATTRAAHERDQAAARSFFGAFGTAAQRHLSAGTLSSNAQVRPAAGTLASQSILHYFAKPYNLLADALV